MRSNILKTLIKQIIRHAMWEGQTKTVTKVLASSCRRDGMPEYGRFTAKEIRRITSQAMLNIKELMPYFEDLDSIGNYQQEYAGLLTLAVYRALLKENIARDYATNLVGDMIWQAYLNNKGAIPIIAPLRTMWWKITTKGPTARLGKYLKAAMKYPFTEPGYKIKLYMDKDVWCMDIYSCTVYDFFKKFGQEEMTFFRKTWCTFDYSGGEYLVEGSKYRRIHTLSDGDELCDARYFIEKQIST
ncbi:MAG: hypothetical protein FJ023_07380 [Chloroflexi bacterium]|nr:hypothetical protein [Chloroflexota bacterium]